MNDQICFVRRRSDGKFLRGSTFFPWVKSWRYAALLPVGTVAQWARPDVGYLLQYGINDLSDIEIVSQSKQLD